MRRAVPAIQPVQANARGSDNIPMPSNIAVVLNNYLGCEQRANMVAQKTCTPTGQRYFDRRGTAGHSGYGRERGEDGVPV